MISMVEGTTARIDALCSDQEYRLDFIRTAIESEIAKRSPPPKAPPKRDYLGELMGTNQSMRPSAVRKPAKSD